ncbi:uncharacterized protein [Ptychodera flava]|uniref:uncharacterized protein n=1 Tax=Ptychodera flava TaxID=63121 RepID=UPI003969C08C
MEDILSPKNFRAVAKAVKVLGGYNGVSYEIPSLVLKTGNNLKALCDIAMAERFKKICEAEWNAEISAGAITTLNEAKWNKATVLPSSEDVQKITDYLSEQTKYYRDKLTAATGSQSVKEVWGNLCQITLTSVIIFNRRRSGEVSKLLVETFTNRDVSPPNAHVLASLSSTEKELLKYFTRIETRGKRGGKVPILLSPMTCDVMELLVTKREIVGLDDNPYFFANPNGAKRLYYRATDTLRACADQADVSNPESLQSTRMRKHVATTCQILNLKDNDMANLAQYMGHDIPGTIAKYRGKNLEEIDINPEEITGHLTEEEDSSSDGDDVSQHGSPNLVGSENMERNTIHPGSHVESSAEKNKKQCENEASEVRKKPVGQKVPWTEAEEAAIDSHFMSHIRKNKTVTKAEAERCLANEKALSKRNWRLLKWHVKSRAIAYERKVKKKIVEDV